MQKKQVSKAIENIFMDNQEYFNGISSIALKSKLERTHNINVSIEMLNDVGSGIGGFKNGGKVLNFEPREKWWSIKEA